MEITAFKQDYLTDMTGLFVENFRKLRAAVPILPDLMEDTQKVTDMLAGLMESCQGIVALDQGRVVGYMGWYLTNDFRGTGRKGSYCPEWGHGAIETHKAMVYRALYRAAAERWTEIGCKSHALTLLAHDQAAKDVWFWNGFGLTVVDAIRSIDSIEVSLPGDVCIRKATPDDLQILRDLEIEHAAHYQKPPVLMSAYDPVEVDELAAFIREPRNSIWLALDGDRAMGYARFDADNSDAVAIVKSQDRVSNTGLFVRPQYRGRKIALAMINAALSDYATQGFRRCSVDFESFNPEAAVFWTRYFTPVGLSVVRVPERQNF